MEDKDDLIDQLKRRLRELKNNGHKRPPLKINEKVEDISGIDWSELSEEAKKLLDKYNHDYHFQKHPKKIYRRVWNLMVDLKRKL